MMAKAHNQWFQGGSAMDSSQFVEYHIVDCIRVAIVEANGEKEQAARLRAQARLRLVCMADDEVWELAKKTCFPPKRTAEDAYHDIKQTIEEYKTTAGAWLNRAFVENSTNSNQ